MRGKKGLVLDPKLSGPLGLIAEVSLLKVVVEIICKNQIGTWRRENILRNTW